MHKILLPSYKYVHLYALVERHAIRQTRNLLCNSNLCCGFPPECHLLCVIAKFKQFSQYQDILFLKK